MHTHQLQVEDLRDEVEERAAVVNEARTWETTPYESNQRVKGPRGGVDCLTFIVEVYERCGLIPHQELPHYSATWHLHRSEEIYIEGISKFCSEIFPRPGEQLPRELSAGDLIVYKMGRCFSHAVIVLEYPTIIQAYFGRSVFPGNAERDAELRGRQRRFFSLWHKNGAAAE